MTASCTNSKSKVSLHFFAVNPEHFIFSHIPARSDMQLLQETVNFNSIVPMISPTVLSLSLGIEPLSWAETVRISDEDSQTIEVTVRVPPSVRVSAKLRRASQNETFQEHEHHTIFIQVQADDNLVNIYATIPSRGLFFLDVYGNMDKNIIPTFSYQINCDRQPVIFAGFPVIHDLPSTALNFVPLYWNTPQPANVCENSKGQMELVFKCQSGTEFNHFITFSGSSSSGVVDIDAQHYSTAISRDNIDASLFKLSVMFPSSGWWTIYLCAVKRGDEISGYTVLLQYTIHVRKAVEKCFYPHVKSADIHFQLDGPISCTGSDILIVPFYSSTDLDFQSCLCYRELDGVQYQEYTLIKHLEELNEYGERRHVLQVVFPRPGKWFVRVFGATAEQVPSHGFLSLFDLPVEVPRCFKNVVFPYMDQHVSKRCSVELMHPHQLINLEDINLQGMLLLKFRAPKRTVFEHYIEQVTDDDDSTVIDPLESKFQRYNTYLILCKENGTEKNYTLKCLIPKPGKWNVVLCAGENSLRNPEVALRVPVNTLNFHTSAEPTVFPLVHPAFSEFGITFPEKSIPYLRHCSLPEFEFEFNSEVLVNFAWTLQDIRNNKQIHHSPNVFLQSTSNSDKAFHKLRLVFPKPGVWIVQVLSRNILTNVVADNTLSLSLHYQPVFNLIIEASTATLRHMAFPRLHESFYTPFGLHIEASDVPLPSRVNQLPTTCIVKFYSPPGVLFWHQCTEASQLQDRKITRMTSHPDTGLHELHADISRRGQWTVFLHAKFENDSSKNWTAVLQHTITARSSKSISTASVLSIK